MDLSALNLKRDYRSGESHILRDFMRPCLVNAQIYWRTAGYFSSSALEAFGSPLGDFVRNGGVIQLITSVELVDRDLEAIEQGRDRQRVTQERMEKIIEDEFQDGLGDGVSRLLALLRLKRLEIKIAVPKTGKGIYHEKLGLFFDNNENVVVFSGSANESKTALTGNFESIDVYTSQRDGERVQDKVRYFERLWADKDPGAEVYTISEAARKKLIRIYERDAIEKKSRDSNKWRHQEQAVEKFVVAERGVLNMATGTGKTRTSFKILKRLRADGLIDTAIISTEGNDLLDQWHRQILEVAQDLGGGFRVFRHYKDNKEQQDFSLNPQKAILVCSRSSVGNALRRLSPKDAARTLLIHDEVHGLGSPGNREKLAGLSDNIRFRLGLSATPDREYDIEGNQFIEEHIGPVIMTFGLAEAIERGILAPFNYFPLDYELLDEDKQKISRIFAQRAVRAKEGNPMSEAELYMAIARVYKTSRAKIPIFDDFIKNNVHLLERCIIFVEEAEYGMEVLDIVHKYRPDFHTYFSGEDAKTLERFASGDLECLLACHRLSEGIDIQSLKNVILFSSARARLETIQRIGRCIRVDPNDPEKMANIVDFIRRSEGDTDEDESNPDLMRAEWLAELSKVRSRE